MVDWKGELLWTEWQKAGVLSPLGGVPPFLGTEAFSYFLNFVTFGRVEFIYNIIFCPPTKTIPSSPLDKSDSEPEGSKPGEK